MARPPIPGDLPLVPSLLDRLVYDSRVSTSPGRRRGQTLSQVREALRRDLEDLLNSYERCVAVSADYDAVSRSIYDYGLPDLTDVDLSSPPQIERFRNRLETAIRRFDPRFRDIKVVTERGSREVDHSLRFRIHAVVHLHQSQEPVVFQSMLEPATRQFTIRSHDS